MKYMTLVVCLVRDIRETEVGHIFLWFILSPVVSFSFSFGGRQGPAWEIGIFPKNIKEEQVLVVQVV